MSKIRMEKAYLAVKAFDLSRAGRNYLRVYGTTPQTYRDREMYRTLMEGLQPRDYRMRKN